MVRLVFIPPLGHDHKFYEPLVQMMGREVTLLDYPYLEQSFDWNSKELIEELAQFFADKINQYDKVKIVGVSLGATISLRIKEILGDKVEHLYLISSGGHKVASFRKEMILTHLRDLGAEEFLLKSLEVGSKSEYQNSDFKSHFHQAHKYAQVYWDYYTQELWKSEHAINAQIALTNLVAASVEVNFEHLLSKFQDQISIIWADLDKVFSMRFYEKFKKLCPRSQFYLLQGVGHFSPLETPKRILHILKGYEKPLTI